MTTIFTDPTPPDEHFRGIAVAWRPRSSSAELAAAFGAPASWLGPAADSPDGVHRRHQADLRLRVNDRPSLVTFQKAAYVDLGPIEPIGNGWEARIGWRAATMAPLFPVFAGRLAVRADELVLSGWYAPPGGFLGRAADAALLRVAATGTARWLLAALDEAAARPSV
jgi:hypothetical protein